MDRTPSRTTLFRVVLALMAVAVGGAVWAWITREGCGSCGGVRDVTARLPLAPAGAAYYTVLLIAGALLGPSRFLFGGVILAGAAHLALLLLLIQRGVFCFPCVVTGLAALAATVISFVIDPENLARGGLLIPAGAMGAHLALFWAGGVMAPNLATPGDSNHQIDTVRARTQDLGKVEMTVFGRAGCPYCIELDERVLPLLQREFGERLRVNHEEASPGLPTPTIVIPGPGGTVFPGLPPLEELRAALRRALMGADHEPSVLSKSR